MILILKQARANSNSDLIKKSCVKFGMDHMLLDVDNFCSSDNFTFDFIKGTIIIDDDEINIKGVFNGVFDQVGKFVVDQFPQKHQWFVGKELTGSLIGSLISLSKVRWVNNPISVFVSGFKLYQLQLARQIGFLVPETIVSTDSSKLKAFWDFYRENGVIIKAVNIGQVSVSDNNKYELLFTKLVTQSHIDKLSSYCSPPVLLQALVRKKREFRVVVVKSDVFCCTVGSDCSVVDWRTEDNPTDLSCVVELPLDVRNKCIKLVEELKLSVGILDLIEDKNGDYYFLEVNQQGGWEWMETKLDLPISLNMVNYLNHN